ncbi:hypothetical protein AAFF_G00190800 [Aldrovandia affinis]|uniref:Uncharacterized protein n=1 Tax=Aldrovandia affinis TaxID=143900 RepID=A0AAD7RJC3_9TELE|nr:hypothetical protein AAFF_G00190800 [Aldrovandia affinis]
MMHNFNWDTIPRQSILGGRGGGVCMKEGGMLQEEQDPAVSRLRSPAQRGPLFRSLSLSTSGRRAEIQEGPSDHRGFRKPSQALQRW